MATLTVQLPSHQTGPTLSAPEASDEYPNNGQALVLAILPAARVVTFHSPEPDLPDLVRTYSAGINLLPRFDPLRWNDPITGRVRFSWDDPSGIQQAAFLVEAITFAESEKIAGSLTR